jgi:crotonobetainyl-CoA hydratase
MKTQESEVSIEKGQLTSDQREDAKNAPPVLVARRDKMMIITLNRPEARNAVNAAVSTAVGDALEEANNDPEIWAVIITGAGKRAFCAGADLKVFANGGSVVPTDPKHAPWGFAGYVSHAITKPTIAAVNGFALGGGTEIALASDLVVAADIATFGLPEVKRGICAAAGGAFRLPRQVPWKIGIEMLLTGEPISAARALELGLINRAVPQADVLEEALKLATKICANAPLAVQASKRVAYQMVDGRVPSEEQAWEISKREGAALRKTADGKEGPAAFSEGRAPRWRAR